MERENGPDNVANGVAQGAQATSEQAVQAASREVETPAQEGPDPAARRRGVQVLHGRGEAADPACPPRLHFVSARRRRGRVGEVRAHGLGFQHAGRHLGAHALLLAQEDGRRGPGGPVPPRPRPGTRLEGRRRDEARDRHAPESPSGVRLPAHPPAFGAGRSATSSTAAQAWASARRRSPACWKRKA